MLFSSLSFLLYFLPPVVLIHLFLPKWLQNPFLFFASLFFYAWGDARFVPLFFGLLLMDWGCGLILEKAEKQSVRKLVLALGVLANMGSLFLFKYMGFFASLIRMNVTIGQSLPLGISFFTFQATGYLVVPETDEMRTEPVRLRHVPVHVSPAHCRADRAVFRFVPRPA